MRGDPNSTAVPSSTKIRVILPDLGEGIWFIVFIASIINKVSPSFTILPIWLYSKAPGSGAK